MARQVRKLSILSPTRAQYIRAEEKAWEMYDVLTRLLVAVCHSDAETAAGADPDVFDDGIALLNYITLGEGEDKSP